MRRILSAATGLGALVLAVLVILRADQSPRGVSRPSRTTRGSGQAADTKFDSKIVSGFVAAIREQRGRRIRHALPGGYLTARGTAIASTSVVVLLLLLALGSIGVVHGLWSKNLTVDGVAETGDLNADWDKIRTEDRCGQTNETEVTPTGRGLSAETSSSGEYGDQDGGSDDPCPPDPCEDGGHHYSTADTTYGGGGGGDGCDNDCGDGHNYNAAETTYGDGGGDPCPPDPCESGGTYDSAGNAYGGGGDHDDDDGDGCPPTCEISIGGVGDDSDYGNQVAYVDIANATPGYWCKIKGWVSNLGSVPFNIIGINGVLDEENDKGISFYDLNGSAPGVCKLVDHAGRYTPSRQVDPGEEGVVYCKVVVDKGEKVCTDWHYGDCKEWTYVDGAKEGWTYHFAVEVCVAQWNEDPSQGGEEEDLDACKHPSLGIHEGPDTPALPTPGPAS